MLVYLREAHPSDGWNMKMNEKAGITVKDPTTQEERDEIARTCVGKLAITMTTVVDDMKDTVDGLYCGWPERFYVVGKDGKIAYKGDLGPFGYKPAVVDKFLEKYLADENNRAVPQK